jgi:hypothetical protein
VTSSRTVDEFPGEFPGAASSLLADLLLQRGLRLVEVARTRCSAHFETGRDDVPVLCVATPEAVRLPNTFVTPALPEARELVDATWRVTRWWHPARPVRLRTPAATRLRCLPAPSCDVLEPEALVGRGAGLTPEGDDLLAAALVTAHATDDPRLPEWRAATRDALTTRRTTAVSRGLLHHALDGYAVPELAAFLTDLCTGRDPAPARARLLSLGHSSGAALLDGVALTLTTRPRAARGRGAA